MHKGVAFFLLGGTRISLFRRLHRLGVLVAHAYNALDSRSSRESDSGEADVRP
jgi:hypothetical protein